MVRQWLQGTEAWLSANGTGPRVGGRSFGGVANTLHGMFVTLLVGDMEVSPIQRVIGLDLLSTCLPECLSRKSMSPELVPN